MMYSEHCSLIINNIKLPIDASFEEAFSVAEQKLRTFHISISDKSFSILKKSIDARNKNDIKFVYSVCVKGIGRLPSDDFLKKHSLSKLEYKAPDVKYGDEPLNQRPVVVGAGPCGMFCALMLAENGYKPLLIERGSCVDERILAVDNLNKYGILDENNNIQFGAGGAGTFSDGKLITRINDSMSTYVLEKLIEFGAPQDIIYSQRPHVGTDILADIVKRILSKITLLGGEVRYNTSLLGINTEFNGNIISIKTNISDIPCGALILAIGHSARDTYRYLIEKGFELEAKPFSVGMRIEHLTKDIDRAMYADMSEHPLIPHAEYNLSYNTKERGVYTFCMCPGGEVVAATSERYGTVTNGMSRHKRDGLNSNSAVVCSIFKEDYGNSPLAAIEFQQKIERDAYIAGGKNYSAPIITVGDFIKEKLNNEPKRVLPTYRGGKNVKLASPESYLPAFVCKSIRAAIMDFNKKIKGFSADDAVLTGAETRTSSPIRILRNGDTRLALRYNNLYPAGEGAGYAGGITSAAIDGIKTALKFMERYKPL